MDYQTKTKLILPFKGELNVTNGGRTVETNNHVTIGGSLSLAYDFRDGHKGEGKNLEDYEVFGKEVLAPADGIIAQVVDGSVDCQPVERDRNVGIGNTIIIDHQNGEWSVLCHLKYNSIIVKVGDSVKQKQTLGFCGNTGNTSEPHIHFHLQNGPLIHNSQALPAKFEKISVDGELKENYEPIRGQRVSNS